MQLLNSMDIIRGVYNRIPDYMNIVNGGLFYKEFEERYEYLVKIGHGLARSVMENMMDGIYPLKKVITNEQKSFRVVSDFDSSILQKITQQKVTFKKVDAGMTMNYQEYKPKRRNPEEIN